MTDMLLQSDTKSLFRDICLYLEMSLFRDICLYLEICHYLEIYVFS